ncbi:MAG: hypothetical protein M3348_00405 [Acidobacteriota bacterium]|nr:hypothetical protein [Acidobacteriota bacterium]
MKRILQLVCDCAGAALLVEGLPRGGRLLLARGALTPARDLLQQMVLQKILRHLRPGLQVGLTSIAEYMIDPRSMGLIDDD